MLHVVAQRGIAYDCAPHRPPLPCTLRPGYCAQHKGFTTPAPATPSPTLEHTASGFPPKLTLEPHASGRGSLVPSLQRKILYKCLLAADVDAHACEHAHNHRARNREHAHAHRRARGAGLTERAGGGPKKADAAESSTAIATAIPRRRATFFIVRLPDRRKIAVPSTNNQCIVLETVLLGDCSWLLSHPCLFTI